MDIRCKKCNKRIKLNPNEEPNYYYSGDYFYEDWAYLKNRILCNECWRGDMIDGLNSNN